SNSTFSSLPVTLPPSQQGCYGDQSTGSADSGTTNIGCTSLLDSGRSTVIEGPVAEWWDQDCGSDSLFSSNEEDSSPYAGNGRESTYPEYDANIEDNELTYGDDGASHHSEEFGVLPNDSTHLELLDPEDDVLFIRSEEALDPGYDEHKGSTLVGLEELGSEYNLDNEFGPSLEEEDNTDDISDGASQRSEDWGIPPDEQSDQGYESLCENEESYQDKVDQYRSGDHGGLNEYLVLVSQSFPRSLWSLQLPKPFHRTKFTKYSHSSKPPSHSSFDTTLLNIISSHIPLIVTLASFEPLAQSTSLWFLENLQLSRQFISTVEGVDVISNYREHLLMLNDGSDSEFSDGEIEVTHDAMDDLFGAGNTSIFNLELPLRIDQSEDSNNRGVMSPNSLRGWNVGSYEYDEGQLDNLGDNKCEGHLALIPSSFPSTLQCLQSPKTRNQPQSRTTDLSPLHDTVYIPVFADLVSLGHTLQLPSVAWTQGRSSCRKEWVEMFDEEAVVNIASNQRLEQSSTKGCIVPVYPPTHHDPLISLDSTGLYVRQNHDDNLEPTSSPCPKALDARTIETTVAEVD
ncbi:hypothetical protein PQX77_021576, partial [Marasmius sp. AFHP31]